MREAFRPAYKGWSISIKAVGFDLLSSKKCSPWLCSKEHPSDFSSGSKREERIHLVVVLQSLEAWARHIEDTCEDVTSLSPASFGLGASWWRVAVTPPAVEVFSAAAGCRYEFSEWRSSVAENRFSSHCEQNEIYSLVDWGSSVDLGGFCCFFFLCPCSVVWVGTH